MVRFATIMCNLLCRYDNYYWTAGQCESREEKLVGGKRKLASWNGAKLKTRTCPGR
jgi:hypothetical protein